MPLTNLKKPYLRISSRKSDLARVQAYKVGAALREKDWKLNIDYKFRESIGDINLIDPLWKMPEKGVFTEEFVRDLELGDTDIVVHSWKDLPTELNAKTVVAATLSREDQRDLVFIKKSALEKIRKSKSITIMTSSPRRTYALESFFKTYLPFPIEKVEFEVVRGNIPKRIDKMFDTEDVDGLVLAKAAWDRLSTAVQDEFIDLQKKLKNQLTKVKWMAVPLSINPNAAAQGALAIEVSGEKMEFIRWLAEINHAQTYSAVKQEREILASYGGGCHQKIGVAVLPRPFGKVVIVKGQTKDGTILNTHEVDSEAKHRFSADEMWADREGYFNRESLAVELPTDYHLFVSKVEALTSANNYKVFATEAASEISAEWLQQRKVIWCGGTMTWEKLAKAGIWVNGCNDALGEAEPMLTDSLSDKKPWAKLTHSESKYSAHSDWQVIPTYQLKRTTKRFELNGKKTFYWHSGSLFLAALAENPEIISAFHCSGPGQSSTAITEALKAKGLSSEDQHQVFLNEDEWRRKCQK